MTTILDHFTGTDEPERISVTVPQHRPATGVPWWAGVPGLDPAIPVSDWAFAASCAAMACAVRVFGADAGYRAGLFKASPASTWSKWLLDATHPGNAYRRCLALRLICDQAGAVDPDQVLQVAKDLLAAVSPPR